jgi:hypothetical protein
MEKNIKDYLHLYIGCNVQWNKARGFTLTKVNWLFNEFEIDQDESGYTETFNEKTVHEIKPILRPLSDMTEEECHTLGWAYLNSNGNKILNHSPEYLNPEDFKYLLSRGFDLFGLIESGLAIDKSSITEK